MSKLFASWFPVPRGRIATGTSVPAVPRSAWATVPSPPAATTARAPSRAAAFAISRASAGLADVTKSNGTSCSAKAEAIRRRMTTGDWPPLADGLMRTMKRSALG
jgi:hypothetical protein